MSFSTHLGISGNPEFDLKVRTAPLDFQLGGEASVAINTGPINGHVDTIPVRVRVPFMRHNHGYIIAASVGPFDVHVQGLDANLRAFGVEIGGILGREGIEADIDGKVRCCMQVDVNGKLPGKVIEAAVKAVLEE